MIKFSASTPHHHHVEWAWQSHYLQREPHSECLDILRLTLVYFAFIGSALSDGGAYWVVIICWESVIFIAHLASVFSTRNEGVCTLLPRSRVTENRFSTESLMKHGCRLTGTSLTNMTCHSFDSQLAGIFLNLMYGECAKARKRKSLFQPNEYSRR